MEDSRIVEVDLTLPLLTLYPDTWIQEQTSNCPTSITVGTVSLEAESGLKHAAM